MSFQLKLDGKQIGTREFWKRQIIVAHRQSEPASYGFYCPARGEANEEGSCTRKKVSSRKTIYNIFTHTLIGHCGVTFWRTLRARHMSHRIQLLYLCFSVSWFVLFDKIIIESLLFCFDLLAEKDLPSRFY